MSCPSQNQAGPFQQTLFLGCSVQSFTSSLGWGNQQTQFTVRVVQDPCGASGGKVYYDSNLNPQTTTGPDPGFMYPPVGSCAYFRIGDFEYAGIIQSWNQLDDFGTHPAFDINLVSPTELLAGCEMIIGGYNGSIHNVANIFNCFGFMESYGDSCSTTFPGAFGGASATSAGMSWNKIKTAISILTSSEPIASNSYSAGRIQFTNPGSGGMGLVDGGTYYLDLSSLPTVPNAFRIGGTNISVLDAISEVCYEAGSDFYVDLVLASYAGGIKKIIKPRSVSRRYQPSLTAINDFINNGSGAISTSRGNELRNEITSAFLVGGPLAGIIDVETNSETNFYDSNMWPYWGLDSNGNVIIGEGIDDAHNFDISLTPLGLMDLNGDKIDGTYNITVGEIRAALADMDTWASYICWSGTRNSNNNTVLNSLLLKEGYGPYTTSEDEYGSNINLKIEYINQLGVSAFSHMKISHNILYNKIVDYGENYYGKKFMVYVNGLCRTYDSETQQDLYNLSPTEGGWLEFSDGLLNIENSGTLNTFRLFDNRIMTFVYFTGGSVSPSLIEGDGNPQLNLTIGHNLNPEDYAYEYHADDVLHFYCKAELTDIVYADYENRSYPRMVLSLPSMVYDPHLYNTFIKTIQDAQDTAVVVAPPMEMFQLKPTPLAYRPIGAALALQDNTNNYGPWYNIGIDGKTYFEQDITLVPWEYGSVDNLNYVANQRVANMNTNMRRGEMGSITMPGYPRTNLGAELLSAVSLYEDRIVNLDSGTGPPQEWLYLTEAGWTGGLGPNITNISTSVDVQNGIQTLYEMRTFTPKFGAFTKANNERFRRISKIQQQQSKNVFDFNRKAKNTKESIINSYASQYAPYIRSERDGTTAHSPHSFLATKYGTSANTIHSVSFKDVAGTYYFVTGVPGNGIDASELSVQDVGHISSWGRFFKPATFINLDCDSADIDDFLPEPFVLGTVPPPDSADGPELKYDLIHLHPTNYAVVVDEHMTPYARHPKSKEPPKGIFLKEGAMTPILRSHPYNTMGDAYLPFDITNNILDDKYTLMTANSSGIFNTMVFQGPLVIAQRSTSDSNDSYDYNNTTIGDIHTAPLELIYDGNRHCWTTPPHCFKLRVIEVQSNAADIFQESSDYNIESNTTPYIYNPSGSPGSQILVGFDFIPNPIQHDGEYKILCYFDGTYGYKDLHTSEEKKLPFYWAIKRSVENATIVKDIDCQDGELLVCLSSIAVEAVDNGPCSGSSV